MSTQQYQKTMEEVPAPKPSRSYATDDQALELFEYDASMDGTPEQFSTEVRQYGKLAIENFIGPQGHLAFKAAAAAVAANREVDRQPKRQHIRFGAASVQRFGRLCKDPPGLSRRRSRGSTRTPTS